MLDSSANDVAGTCVFCVTTKFVSPKLEKFDNAAAADNGVDDWEVLPYQYFPSPGFKVG
jgi:hypothetical protein